MPIHACFLSINILPAIYAVKELSIYISFYLLEFSNKRP